MKKGSVGKMNSVYNSVSEVKIRILLLLEHSTQEYLSSDLIAALDFITVYGKEFGVSDKNLHGDNRFKYSELPSRRQVVAQSIRTLVVEGMLNFSLKRGFEYSINDKGINFVDNLESLYALEYSEIVRNTFRKYGNIEEAELFKIIQTKSLIPTIRRDD